MKLLKKLFNKYIQKRKAVYIHSDSAYSVTMLQSLEPRKMFDAALGVEIANLFTQQAAAQGQEADFLAADTADDTQTNQALDAFITDSTLDPNIVTNINDEATNLLTSSTNLDDYYSFDKSLVKEIVFVDSDIDNYAELLEGVDLDKLISGQLEVVVIDSKYSGIEQIGNYLNQYDHQLEAVHIVSHGDVAELKLGSDVLNNASLDDFNSSLATWGASFAVGADLLFYGCNVAEGVAGQKFVQDLHNIIETDIAASSDLTGHVDLGGDWDLEVTQGEITAKLAFSAVSQINYEGLLATITVTTLDDENDAGDLTLAGQAIPDGAGISLREAIAAANANSGIDTILFSVAGTINLDYDNTPLDGQPDQLNITEGVIIDGTTAPGYISGTPVVTITSLDIASNASGSFVFNNADGSEIRGLAFQVNITALSPNYTLNFTNSDNITVEDNVFGNPAGNNNSKNYGVSFSGAYDNITIQNNTFQNSFKSAIVINNNFTNVDILNNTIKNIGSNTHPIAFSPTADNVSALVSGNTIFNQVGQPLPALGAIGVGINSRTGIHIEVTQNISYDITTAPTISVIDYKSAISNNTLLGPQANDTDDVGLATDNRLNYPVVTKVDDLGSGYYRIIGYVDVASTAENRYRLEFFADDNTSKPQAQVYVGSLLLNNSNSSLVADNGSGSIQDRAFQFITGNLSSAGLTLANIRFAVSNTDTTIGHTSELPGGTLAATTPTEITVTTLADENDGTTTNLGSLIVNPGGTGISLREAIIAANNQSGANTIKFGVSGNFVFSLEAAANFKLPAITDVLIIDGTTASGYVAPATPVNPNSPSNPTQAGASGLFGINTTAVASPSGPTQSLLGGVIGSTLDIYDGSNNYEADIKGALNTAGNIKVFFETTSQVGGTTAILKFESGAANSQVKGIGFLQNSSALSAMRSDVAGVDVYDSYFKGFTSASATDAAVVNIVDIQNSVFDSNRTATLNATNVTHNTVVNNLGTVANPSGNFNFNKLDNTGFANQGFGVGVTGSPILIQGNYFKNLNYSAGVSSTEFKENEILNMAHASYALLSQDSVYTTFNKIHDNTGSGIYATVTTANGTNRIGSHLANSLYNNGGLGIDTVFDAVTGSNSNDFNDVDLYQQNTPYIGSVTQVSSTNGNNGDNGDMKIVGSLNSGSAANQQFRIDFYANTGGLSGNINNSEAEYFLGYTIVNTSNTATGYNAYFQFTYDYSNPQAGAVPNVLLSSGSYIVATATGTVPNSATPSGAVFGTAYKTYETSELFNGQNTGYSNAQELPTAFAPTIDYTGVITVGNNFTTDTTPVLLGELNQPYDANINISIVRIDNNSGGETVVHTANPANITKDLANGTWQYDLTSYFTAPVGAYRLDISINDGLNSAVSIPGTTFSKVFIVAADSNSLGVIGETAYNNATSSYPIEGSVNNSSNPVFIEIDTGDGNGTQILQATANGATGWQLSSLPSYNIIEGGVPYTLHVFNNSGAYDTANVAQGFIIDTTNPDADMDSITGLATAPELTGTFTDANDVTAIIVSIAPTGSLDINNLVPSNTFVVGSDPHSVLNPGFQSVTGSINKASNTWTINSGQITGLSSGISYDVVVMGLDPAGNITSLSSGSILSGAITVTQNLDTALNDLLSSLNALLADNGVISSGDGSLTGTASHDVIGNSTDDVVNAALRAASDAQSAANSALQHAQAAQAQAEANPGNASYQDSANAAQQAAQAAQAAADASQAQANQAQTAQASGNSTAAQQASASAQAASSAAQAAEQSAGGGSSGEGGVTGMLSGFAQAFSNVATGAAGSAGAVANIVFDISWNTMVNQPATSAAAAAAGFTITLTVISGGQVVSVVFTTGGFGSGTIAALQNATGSIFQNMGANMLRFGGTPTMTTTNKVGGDVGAQMSDANMQQTQDFNQEQDVELSEDTDCILNRYVNALGRKVSKDARVMSRE